MRRNLLLLVLGVSVSALSGSAAARNAAVTNELPFDKCPTAAEARSADNSHYIQLAEAASGAEKRIPKVFRSAPAAAAAGRPFAFQMDSGYRMGIGSLYFANASKFCGVPVAQSSWAFSISIPTAQNALQASFMVFAAKSRNGWRVYGGVQLN